VTKGNRGLEDEIQNSPSDQKELSIGFAGKHQGLVQAWDRAENSYGMTNSVSWRAKGRKKQEVSLTVQFQDGAPNGGDD